MRCIMHLVHTKACQSQAVKRQVEEAFVANKRARRSMLLIPKYRVGLPERAREQRIRPT